MGFVKEAVLKFQTQRTLAEVEYKKYTATNKDEKLALAKQERKLRADLRKYNHALKQQLDDSFTKSHNMG